jgi:flagellar biosynthesis protein FlhA
MKRFVVLALALVLLTLIPLPALALDIMIALNLILVIPIYFIVLYSRKITDFSPLPVVLLWSSIFGLIITISAARLILTKGAFFDGWIIRTVAFEAAGSGEITRLIIVFALFIVFAAVMGFMIARETTHISEITAWYILEILPGKQLAIDFGHNCGASTEEEAIIGRNALRRESDFVSALDSVGKFISGYAKICCFITAVSILGGTAIDVLLRGKTLADAVKTYIPLSIGSGALSLCHIVLLSIATGWGIGKAADLENYEG